MFTSVKWNLEDHLLVMFFFIIIIIIDIIVIIYCHPLVVFFLSFFNPKCWTHHTQRMGWRDGERDGEREGGWGGEGD